MNAFNQDSELRPAERRRAQRGRTFRSAKLLYGSANQSVLDCLLVELSADGARVETAIMSQVPEILLLRLADGAEHKARRAWATGNLIGLEFLP